MMETYRKEDIRRGDIYYADLRPVVGSEQGGIRPVVILQNNVGNRHSPTVIAAAITSRKGKHKLPTHVNLDAPVPGLYRDSMWILLSIYLRWMRSTINCGNSGSCAAVFWRQPVKTGRSMTQSE